MVFDVLTKEPVQVQWIQRAACRGRLQGSYLATSGSVRRPTKLCAALDWCKDCWRLQLGCMGMLGAMAAMGAMGAMGTVCNLSWLMFVLSFEVVSC